MFRGSKQGGGGSSFVTLTGLFPTKKGTGVIGSIKPEAFDTLGKMMEECFEKNVDLVFFIAEDKERKGKAVGYLSATVGTPREPQQKGGSRFGNKYGSQQSAPRQSNSGGGLFGGGNSGPSKNPPKDPLDGYLEDTED
jgi:hypothetical protein